MNPIKKYIKGFISLGIVIFAISVLGWGIYLLHHTSPYRSMITQQLSPFFVPGFPSGNEWCIVIASEEFLSKSVPDKIIFAERFYEKNIKGIAENLFYDNKKMKSWFINTAQMTLQEAPIKDYPDIAAFNKHYQYRDLMDSGWPHIQYWKPFLNSATLLFSLVTTLIILAVIIIIFSIMKWVSGRFKPTKVEK